MTRASRSAHTGFDDPYYLDGLGAVLAGTANVVMQLAMAPVGYGVLESKVESGQITKHPIKRFRTTFTYLAVALLGDEQERAHYRNAVNRAHRLVRSDEHSPVSYNAFDPHLQLWVAACLYFGAVDLLEKLHGPMSQEKADAFYVHAARLGTTLQVPPSLWPADRQAFARYWDAGLARIAIDEPVRTYLHGLITRDHLPLLLRGSRRFNVWVTTGFLPEPVRKQMNLTWSQRDQHRFESFMRGIGAVQRRVPRFVRRFPFNWFMIDLRLRIRSGRRLV